MKSPATKTYTLSLVHDGETYGPVTVTRARSHAETAARLCDVAARLLWQATRDLNGTPARAWPSAAELAKQLKEGWERTSYEWMGSAWSITRGRDMKAWAEQEIARRRAASIKPVNGTGKGNPEYQPRAILARRDAAKHAGAATAGAGK